MNQIDRIIENRKSLEWIVDEGADGFLPDELKELGLSVKEPVLDARRLLSILAE